MIVDGIEDTTSQSVGGEGVTLQALSLLGLDDFLISKAFSPRQRQLTHVLVASRCLAPASEAKTHRWLHRKSSLLSLLAFPRPPSLISWYRVGDRLYEHAEELVSTLFEQSQSLFGFELSIVFYDLTNTYCYGKEQEELLRYGRSKEKRSDCVLAWLALVMDASGFPCGFEIFKGNISEPKTFAKAIEKLGKQRPTIIMDAGMATKANGEYMPQQGLPWLCIERSQKVPPPQREAHRDHASRGGAQYCLWDVSQTQEVKRIHVQSTFRKKAQDAFLKKKRQR